MNIGSFIKNNLSTILTITGVATGAGAIIVATKETHKYEKAIESYNESIPADTKKSEVALNKLWIGIKEYKFTLLLGALSIGQIAYAHKISLDRIASAGGIATMYKAQYDRLKEATDKILSDKEKQKVVEEKAKQMINADTDNSVPVREAAFSRTSEESSRVKTFVLEFLSTDKAPFKFHATMHEIDMACRQISSILRNDDKITLSEIVAELNLGYISSGLGDCYIESGTVGLSGTYRDNFEFKMSPIYNDQTDETWYYLELPCSIKTDF